MNENHFQPILDKKLGFLFDRTREKMIHDELERISPAASLSIDLCTNEDKQKAERFVEKKILDSEGQIFFEMCPLLRIPDRIVRENHKAMVKETLERIKLHKDDISRFLPGSGDISQIKSVSGDGADVHNHGRLTLVIETLGGKFIYKPHSCKADTVVYKMTKNLFSDVFRVPAALDYGEYGFTEFIQNRVADNIQDICSFYENFGGLTAVVQAFGGTDFHFENFLAEGKYPVLVDLETFITPQPYSSTNAPSINSFASDFRLSVNISGILPCARRGVQFSPLLNLMQSNKSMPMLNGKRQNVWGYENNFIAGFERIYDRCIELREQLKEYAKELKDAQVRHICRDTTIYAKAIQLLNSYQACNSQDGKQNVYEYLKSKMFYGKSERMKNVFTSELEALEERDIPLFYTSGESLDLYSYGKVVVEKFFEKSAMQTALERINRLSLKEKEFEKGIIKRSFETTLRSRVTPLTAFPSSSEERLSKEKAVNIAGKLLEKVYSFSTVSPCGQRGFIGRRSDVGQGTVLPFSVSSGTGGICIFASAMAKIEPKYRLIADELISCSRNQAKGALAFFKGPGLFSELVYDVGLAEGLGGLLTVFSLVPELCSNEIVKELREITENLPLDKIVYTDIYTGLSGYILGLNRVRDKFNVVPAVRRAADRILELKNFEYKGRVLWKNINTPRHLSGYGHGMGGIGAGLMTAYNLTGDSRYFIAASEAYAFEHEIWSEKMGTWPDFRKSPVPDTAMYGICSGSPGMFICFKTSEESKLPFVCEDMKKALDTVIKIPPLFRDHLCCGNSAFAESLIIAGKLDEASQVLGRIENRAKRCKWEFSYISEEFEPFFVPGFFYGASGIGYTMLRYAHPVEIPSVFI